VLEQNLVEDIINNKAEAFQHLVEKHQTMVINTCYGFLHNYQDAQDVAQEVFIEVYKSISKFRKEAKLSTWLYRISTNKSLNYIRDNKKRSWFQSLDDLFEKEKTADDSNSTESPQDILENNEKLEIINQAIDKLAKNQKIAFVLYKYEDLSYKEIAEVMKISLSSVESLLFRAKKNLQKTLVNYFKNT
jgi:RNA polymerase sigma-70 factor (ECF subfamily)